MTTQDKLTPEILTAAGYKKLFNGSYIKEIDNAKMEIIFNNIGELSIFYLPYIKLKALDSITVMEFNTLLDIVKLNKFKINTKDNKKMPNYITNLIKVTEGDFDEVATYVKSEKQNFDFNTLIPCPKEFEQFNGVSDNDEKAVAFWAAFFDNTQSAENKQASVKELLEIPKELFSYYFWNGLKRYKLWEKYSDFDSYYWCIRHWNCKWNASDSEIYANKKTFFFQTPWNAPFPIYKALAKKFPKHKFQVYFADLEGLFFAGKAICEKGNVVLLQNYGSDCKELKDNNIKIVEEIINELKN